MQLAGTGEPIMSAKEQTVARARILVADDHELMRESVVRLLKRHFDVVAAVATGEALLEAGSSIKT